MRAWVSTAVVLCVASAFLRAEDVAPDQRTRAESGSPSPSTRPPAR
jgi:hypothetical protein